QQLQELDAAELDVAGVELRKRGVRELLLDLADVLFDARSGRERLFMLQTRERGLGFLICEVDADGAGSEQGDCDERQDQQQVFSEQPAAMHASRRQRFDVHEYFLVHYRIIGLWISSSVRSSIDCEVEIPSVFAVFKLVDHAIELFGCSTIWTNSRRK